MRQVKVRLYAEPGHLLVSQHNRGVVWLLGLAVVVRLKAWRGHKFSVELCAASDSAAR